MNFRVAFKENNNINLEKLGEFLIEGLTNNEYFLNYEDVYDYYSTIDFRKKGCKYNVMLVVKEDHLDCSTTVYRSILTLLLKKNHTEKLSSFDKLIRSVLTNNSIQFSTDAKF